MASLLERRKAEMAAKKQEAAPAPVAATAVVEETKIVTKVQEEQEEEKPLDFTNLRDETEKTLNQIAGVEAVSTDTGADEVNSFKEVVWTADQLYDLWKKANKGGNKNHKIALECDNLVIPVMTVFSSLLGQKEQSYKGGSKQRNREDQYKFLTALLTNNKIAFSTAPKVLPEGGMANAVPFPKEETSAEKKENDSTEKPVTADKQHVATETKDVAASTVAQSEGSTAAGDATKGNSEKKPAVVATTANGAGKAEEKPSLVTPPKPGDHPHVKGYVELSKQNKTTEKAQQVPIRDLSHLPGQLNNAFSPKENIAYPFFATIPLYRTPNGGWEMGFLFNDGKKIGIHPADAAVSTENANWVPEYILGNIRLPKVIVAFAKENDRKGFFSIDFSKPVKQVNPIIFTKSAYEAIKLMQEVSDHVEFLLVTETNDGNVICIQAKDLQ